jgi:predicted HAD superfamily Cof-like phosphohydrolase
LAYPIQQSVADFHVKYGHPVRDTPQTIEEGEAAQAYSFIEEEMGELYDALYPIIKCDCGDDECPIPRSGPYNPNLTEIADALGDIIVTAYGKGLRHGIDMDLVLAEIMRANMTKEGNGMGKIRKGKDYVAPDVAAVLARQA